MTRPTVEAPVRLALDTNQWNYLVDDSPLGLDLEALRRASRSGRVRVVGSVDLLEEIMGTAPSNWDKYEQMVELFYELVGPRLLRPLNERHPMEVTHGGLLPARLRYLPRATRNGLIDISRDPLELDAVALGLAEQKAQYVVQQRQLREDAGAALVAAGHRLTFKNFRRWYEEEADHADWLASVVNSGVERGLYESPATTDWSFRRFPSAWMFMTFQLAKIVFTVGDNRKIRGSDLADAHHAAAGPYYDLMVTDDQLLRAAMALMPVHRRTCSARQFTPELEHVARS